jgi:hypothetical protein
VHDVGDAGIIEVEGVPGAAAEVGFGLEKDGAGGEEGELVVGVFEEVTGVEGDLEPRRIDGGYDAFDALGGAAEAPMVFEAEGDAAFFGFGDESFQGFNDPGEAVFIGEPGEWFFDTIVGHEVVEIFRSAPSASVDAHGGDAEAVGLFDLGEGFVDIGLAFLFIGGEETLVGGEAHEVEAEGEGALFYFLQGGVGLVFHLDLEDFDAVEAHVGGEFEASLNGAELFAAEAPKGVGGDADGILDSRAGGFCGEQGRRRGTGEQGGGSGGGVGEEVAAVHEWGESSGVEAGQPLLVWTSLARSRKERVLPRMGSS